MLQSIAIPPPLLLLLLPLPLLPPPLINCLAVKLSWQASSAPIVGDVDSSGRKASLDGPVCGTDRTRLDQLAATVAAAAAAAAAAANAAN